MRLPNFTDNQFINAQLLNTALALLKQNDQDVGDLLYAPGLANQGSIGITAAGLTLTFALPNPFAVLFGNGDLVTANGNTDFVATTNYPVSLAALVPTTGSVTAYVVASVSTIKQMSANIPGPPPAHPDFDPTFAPFTSNTEVLDTLVLTATLTPPDNQTTFELARTTLVPGQTTIATWDLTHQVLALPTPFLTLFSNSHLWTGSNTVTNSNYAVDTGTANNLVIALNPAVPSLTDGLMVRLRVAVTNTGPVTLTVNGFGPLQILRGNQIALGANAIFSGTIIQLVYSLQANSWYLLSTPGVADLLGGLPTPQGAFAFTKFQPGNGGVTSAITVPAGVIGLALCQGGRNVADQAVPAGSGGQANLFVDGFLILSDTTDSSVTHSYVTPIGPGGVLTVQYTSSYPSDFTLWSSVFFIPNTNL